MKNNYNMISKKSQHKKLKFLTIVLIISTTFVCIHWILILPANATQTVGESLKKSSQRIVKETTEIKIQELLSSNSSIIPQIPLGDGKIYKFLSTEKLLLKDLKDFVFYKGKFENGHQIFQKFDRISSLEMTPNLRGSINSRSTIFLRKSFLYLGGIFVLTKSCYQTGKFIIYIYHSAINQTNKIRKLILDYLVSDPNLIKIKPIERYIQVEIHNSNEKNFTYFLKTLNLLIVINLIDSIFPNQRVKIVDSFPVNLNPKLCCKNSFLFRVRKGIIEKIIKSWIRKLKIRKRKIRKTKFLKQSQIKQTLVPQSLEIEKEVLELIKIFKKDSNLNYLTFSETKSIIYDKFSINWVYDPSRNHFVPRILKVTPAIDTIENFKIQFQIDISSQFSGLEFIVIHRVKFGSDYFNF